MAKVLFLSRPGNASPWLDDFTRALGDDYDIEQYDPARPFAEQVVDALAVADLGLPQTPDMVGVARAAGVRLWQVIGAGTDHIDPRWISEPVLPIANTPGPLSAPALAEHALLLMLTIARRFALTQEHLAEGRFFRAFADELCGKTLGVVGLGASGAALARAVQGLGMDVVAVTRSRRCDVDGVDLLGGMEALDALLGRSDVVSLHLPATDGTRGLIDAGRLAAMRRSGVLINVARGRLVDQAALVAALRDGTIRAAGLDVFADEPIDPADPLLALPNVVATPHVAGSTHETSTRRGAAAAENVRRAQRGLPPLYPVTKEPSP